MMINNFKQKNDTHTYEHIHKHTYRHRTQPKKTKQKQRFGQNLQQVEYQVSGQWRAHGGESKKKRNSSDDK